MRIIVVILFLIIGCQSCYVYKERKRSKENFSVAAEDTDIIKSVAEQNITLNNFYIQKAEIEFSDNSGKEKLVGSVKFEKPDKYLISLKSRTGVEILRFFITDDTILANDRINKKLYYGSGMYLESKFGLRNSFTPVLFGDYITDKESVQNKAKCIDGYIQKNETGNNLRIRYTLDCGLKKVIEAISDKGFNKPEVVFHYRNFKRTGNVFIPYIIEIRENDRFIRVIIKIKKVEFQWEGNIEFIPGNRYELRRLL